MIELDKMSSWFLYYKQNGAVALLAAHGTGIKNADFLLITGLLLIKLT